MDLKRVLVALTSILVLTAVAVSASAFPNPLGFLGLGKKEPTPARQTQPVSGGAPASFAPVAHAAKPAVVNVSTTQTVRAQGLPEMGPGGPFGGEQDPFSQFFRRFFGPMPRSFKQRSLGSGFIIDADGSIVTNAHVVKDADKIVVKLEDKREFDAKVVGIDEKTDVALLKIDPPADLTVAALGDSDTLQVGDWVVAIGNPFGLSETVTAGIVSAKGRVIGEGPYDDFIQTDASINPGNSGGPLLDLNGRVVGINAAIFSQSGGNIGIGFAIPVNLAKSVVDQLKAHGKVVRAWLGVAIQDVTPDLARSFGLKKAEGALVADVTPDGPAARAGVARGDLIVAFDGTHIDEAHQLPTLVAGTPVGKTVRVTVLREGATKELSVTVAEMPATTAARSGRKTTADWGLTVADITPELAAQFGLQQNQGVVITDVTQNSPAGDAGLQPGDVIREVNRRAVRDVKDYEAALEAGQKGRVLLLIQRQDQSFFVAVQSSSP